MRLKIKLPLFTVLFVLMVSIIIIAISVHQIRVKGHRDVENIRKVESLRVENTLKARVNTIRSLLDAQRKGSVSKTNITVFLDNVKGITYDEGSGYFWISEPAQHSKLIIHPFAGNLTDRNRSQVLALVRTMDSIVRTAGEGYYRVAWPKFTGTDLTTETYTKLCYAKLYKPLGWVIASGRYLDDAESAINTRSQKIREDVSDIIKERILYSIVILSAFIVVIIFFSSRITLPINRLVSLTEEIASEKRGYSSRIEVVSKDEIGRLASSFNKMLSHIEKTMAKLEENAAQYRELVESANSAIIRVDKDCKILFFNEHAQKTFGYAAQDVHGKNILDLIAPEDHADEQRPSSAFSRMFDDPEEHRYGEHLCVAKTGDRIWIAWSNRPIYDGNGDLKEVLCVGSNITARKTAEDLAAMQQRKLIQTDKMATLGILVSGIAHEINNPNNFIILNSENLKRFWDDVLPVIDAYHAAHPDYALSGLPFPEARKEMPGLISGITDGSRRIKRIVQSLKNFARQETDDASKNINMEKVVETATLIVGGLIKKSTDSFTISRNGPVPDVRGKPQQLEQVVINLITNACQATLDKAKPITVIISFDKPNRQVVVSVHDKGIGIKEENMKYIMDPFYTTRRDSGGTGLGLSISYSIIKDHGGELRIESQPGQGTCAMIMLPEAI